MQFLNFYCCMDAILTRLDFDLQIVQQYAKELGYSFVSRHLRGMMMCQ